MTANTDAEPTAATDDNTPEPTALKKLYLATLGAGVVIREESGKLFEHLVERGTPLEEPVRQHAATARDALDRDLTRAGKAVHRAVDRVVTRYSTPKEEEIAELTVVADRIQERMEKL